MVIESYQPLGGVHPVTAALKNSLAALGVTAPHTGRPFSEAMLLGIGGGLGMGYILWEFKAYDSAILVLGFHYRWNYPLEFMQNLCRRIGIQSEVKETGGQKTAAAHLHEAIADGRPAIAWVDQSHLPYFHLSPMYDGCFGHIVTAYGLDEGEKNGVVIDDRALAPFIVDQAAFATARARVASYKNRLVLIEPAAEDIDLKAAVMAGLGDCIEHLGQSSDSFALPAIRKWAKLMTDTRNKKGWPVVFKERKGLYDTLKFVFEGIELLGTGGGALRALYADFLEEAAPVTGKPALTEAAAQYRTVAALWSKLAVAALPDRIPPLRETRALLARKHHLLMNQGNDGLDEVRTVAEQLQTVAADVNECFPLDDKGVQELFAGLQEHLWAIYQAEKEALTTLREAVES
jgi:hypothetical protein